jgi:hypothetical protein
MQQVLLDSWNYYRVVAEGYGAKKGWWLAAG